MTRKRRLILVTCGAIVAIVVISGIFITATHSDKHKKAVADPATVSSISTPAPDQNATSSTTESPTTTSTTAVVDPQPETLRTPVHCSASGSPKAGTLPGDDPNGPKRWVTVAHLSGACDGSSGSFTLKGIDTRVAYSSDASNFNAFLIDSKEGLDATAGYADVECAGSCADNQALVDQAGTYSLRVQADGGPWEIVIQEYR